MSGRFFRSVSDSESESSSEEEELLSDDSDDETAAAPKKAKAPKGSDDSDEDDSDEDDEEDEDNDDDEKKGDGAKKPMSRFMKGAASDDSDSEEDVKRVIKSAKDKRLDEMEAVVKSIENAQRIDDWVAISKGEWKKHFWAIRELLEVAKVGHLIPLHEEWGRARIYS